MQWLVARLRRGLRQGFLKHPLSRALKRNARLGFSGRHHCRRCFLFVFVARLADQGWFGGWFGGGVGVVAGKGRDAGGGDLGSGGPGLWRRHDLGHALDIPRLGERHDLDERLVGSRRTGPGSLRRLVAPGSRPSAAPPTATTTTLGLGVAVALHRVAGRVVRRLAGRHGLAPLGDRLCCRGRPGLSRLFGSPAAAAAAAAAAFFLALRFENRFVRHGGTLANLLVFAFVFLFLDQGWGLDRPQRRRLARAIGAQPLHPEVRRDQRIVLRDHDLDPVAGLDLV